MIDQMNMTVPERLDAVKEKLGFKFDTELGRLIGATKQAVGGWRNDGKRPSQEYADILEERAGIRAEWFRFGRGHMEVGALSDKELYDALTRKLESCSEEHRAQLAADYIKVFSKYL